MISWRYHVVSIVAVVLAFGLGILAGTSVVGGSVSSTTLAEELRRGDSANGTRPLATWSFYERFAVGLQPSLRDGDLIGQEAVVVTLEGVDRPAQRTVEELTAAGVDVLATLELTRLLAEPEIEDNAAVLGWHPRSVRVRIPRRSAPASRTRSRSVSRWGASPQRATCLATCSRAGS